MKTLQYHKLQLLNMTTLQDFVVLAKIGQGSYSSVLKVKRISDGNIYALKKVKIGNLNQKQKENALNQVRLLASITSEYIIAFKQTFFDQQSNTLCVILQYAEEGDLEKLIEKRKRTLQFLPQHQIWKMIQGIVSGLNVLHQANIIHRDLKSANIFISHGQYKLGDFNVSKLLKKSLAYTQTGTPYYASPQVWKDLPYDHKSDIWSLGCIVYEACALKPPFTANSLQGLFKRVNKGNYPRIPGNYSLSLQKFISKCLQQDPKKRPTCKQLLKLIPQSKQQFHSQQSTDRRKKSNSVSQINLLQTIKIPKNKESWKQGLPKANYEMTNSTLQVMDSKTSGSNKYGRINQQRLREIVKQKQQESYHSRKKLAEIASKLSPDYNMLKRNIQSEISYPTSEKNRSKHQQRRQLLPRIKVHSQPSDVHDKVQLLKKIRDAQRKKYQYNRPIWWG